MFSFFTSQQASTFTSTRPNIHVRIPNDVSTFNPKEYPNVVFKAEGRLSGEVHVVHGGQESDKSGKAVVTSQIYVTQESDKEKVRITPTLENGVYTIFMEGPRFEFGHPIYHDTTIEYPRDIQSVDSLTVTAPSTSLNGSADLRNLAFRTHLSSQLSNGHVCFENADAELVRLHTTNGSISGVYKAGHVELQSTNGGISSKLALRDAADGQQSRVATTTTNGTVDIHATAVETTRGLWMENGSSNGRVTIAALVGKASLASVLKIHSTNGRVDLNADLSQSNQPAEVSATTTSSLIGASVMVPREQLFKGLFHSTNSGVQVNLTEDFYGNFKVETTNSHANVEGSELVLEHSKNTSKQGHRGEGPSTVDVHSTNGSANLRFFPAGQSLAA
ncbi:hypothetical protein BGW38_007476 [Lunasporangiospora selenospora]|uniref:Adhesin domain-containing protein n=1 Tax=Lunasporangiospora selenospora TaxID=979761 RepID=A0A9P6K9N9_9FUNG|nr:hypothetical protein BGW38_007476 [Lunasporangiospora selenospora]